MRKPLLAATAIVLLASLAGAQTTMPTTSPGVSPMGSTFVDYFTKPSQGWRDRAVETLRKSPALTKKQAAAATNDLWAAYHQSPEAIVRLAAAQHDFCLSAEGEPLVYTLKTTGERGPNGYAIFLDMHGGGEGPPEMNDGDWKVHQTRYTVPGKLVAIRAPRDTWDQFHNEYFHTFTDRLVEQMILAEDADPNRIYIQGFSSGGYGVMQLAPSLPDRFAAAACNAAASEGSLMENLRDLPFVYRVGENDTMYGRAKLAKETGAKLAQLQHDDPKGYDHWFEMVAGHGHGFDDRGDDAWMASKTRDAYPSRIVWWQNQSDRPSSNPIRHQRYWLAIDADIKRDGHGTKKIEATRDGQTIALTVDGYTKVRVRLNDAMLDLDRPVTVTINGKTVVDGQTVSRRAETLLSTFLERKDPTYAFAAELVLDVPAATTVPTTMSCSPLPPGEELGVRALAEAKAPSEAEHSASANTSDSASAAALSSNPSPGERGEPDADLEYLRQTMPAFDRQSIAASLLTNNTTLAREAIAKSPWADAIEPEMYRNYVLPYANFDEHRDDWRPRLYAQLHEQACKQPTRLDAAKWINDHFAELFDVRYNAEKRPKPDMSPFESLASRYDSCTGLSILLVDACRSVGIPARCVGVPAWTKNEGNHTWVEVWDGQWWSIGDSGTDPRGDDWVKDRCRGETDPDAWEHSVYALCWRPTNAWFPEVWNANQRALPALNVTRFYMDRIDYKLDVPGEADATIRVYWAGELIVKKVGHGTVSLPLAGGSMYTIKTTTADGKETTREVRT